MISASVFLNLFSCSISFLLYFRHSSLLQLLFIIKVSAYILRIIINNSNLCFLIFNIFNSFYFFWSSYVMIVYFLTFINYRLKRKLNISYFGKEKWWIMCFKKLMGLAKIYIVFSLISLSLLQLLYIFNSFILFIHTPSNIRLGKLLYFFFFSLYLSYCFFYIEYLFKHFLKYLKVCTNVAFSKASASVDISLIFFWNGNWKIFTKFKVIANKNLIASFV